MPPATSSSPSGRNAWPAQNASQGVATAVKVPVVGSQMLVVNEPASNAFRSFPEPATRSTLPVCMSATCDARTGEGLVVTFHDPWHAAPSKPTSPTTKSARQRGLTPSTTLPSVRRRRSDANSPRSPFGDASVLHAYVVRPDGPRTRLELMATVRAAVPEDAAAVEAVWAAVAAEGEWIGTELPLDPGWGRRYLAALDAQESAWFIADEGGQAVGGVFVHAERGVAHLGMAIVEEYRGVGLGRPLLDAAVGWARDRGCHKVSLEVWPHNVRARRLYEGAGFVDEGHLRRHYRRSSGALWDAVIMSLILDHDAPGRPES